MAQHSNTFSTPSFLEMRAGAFITRGFMMFAMFIGLSASLSFTEEKKADGAKAQTVEEKPSKKEELAEKQAEEKQDSEYVPPARLRYKGRTIAVTMHWQGAAWLLRKTREREESAVEMLKELNLKPGMVVCDLGCGNGYHALRMAKSVAPNGKVVGVDIQPEMLTMLKERADKQGITNVVRVLGKFHDPNLKPDSLDRILIVDAYHEFSHPELILKALHRALKPGGQIVLVEYRAEDKSVPIKELHKMSKAQVKKELEPNGFKLVREYDKLPWQHMMFFGKQPEK